MGTAFPHKNIYGNGVSTRSRYTPLHIAPIAEAGVAN